MNKEIKIFKEKINKINLENTLGFSLLQENVFNFNTDKEFFICEFINKLNKKLQFTYYPCSRSLISNEIVVILMYNEGGTTALSSFLAYSVKNRTLSFEDIEQYRFKVDCENIEKSIEFQLQKIIKILQGDFNRYISTEERIFIPMYNPKDDY